MIFEKGEVVSCTGDAQSGYAISVSTSVKTTCGSCEQQPSCGTSSIASYLASRAELLSFTVDRPYQPGDSVTLQIPETSLLTASFLAYLLPIIVFIATLMVSQTVLTGTAFNHELVHLTFAIASTWLSYRMIKHYLRQREHTYAPDLCRRIQIDTSSH